MSNEVNDNRTFISFLIGENLFGVDILLVREINKQLDLSTVPQAPDYVKGLINLRGQIVTVLDLRCRIGQGHCQMDGNSHNIVMKNETELSILRTLEGLEGLATTNDNVGLLVDSIGEVITIPETEIEPPPANLEIVDSNYVSGVVKMDNQLMAVLNLDRVLDHSKAS